MNIEHDKTIFAQNTQFVKSKLQARQGQSAAAARQEAWSMLCEMEPQLIELHRWAVERAASSKSRYTPRKAAANLIDAYWRHFHHWIEVLTGAKRDIPHPYLKGGPLTALAMDVIGHELGIPYCFGDDLESALTTLDAVRTAYDDMLAHRAEGACA